MLCRLLRFDCLNLLGASRSSPSSTVLIGRPRRYKACLCLSQQQSPGAASTSDNGEEMEGQKKQPEKVGDIMADSFGIAYATRSSEEGFGGIYGESQSLTSSERITVSKVREDHPDNHEGSLKETEKGRNTASS